MQIAIITSRASETEFYRLLSENARIPIKELCRKLPRTMVYRYLKQLTKLQEESNTKIISTSATICPVSGLPGKVISREKEIQIKRLENDQLLVILHAQEYSA
ncbi:hypothetical protein KY363_04270 [Candidatus Woesearchaeota archaeon]|nr:hypothetical protein [Candidatus Woesearchaeota archaeon]